MAGRFEGRVAAYLARAVVDRVTATPPLWEGAATGKANPTVNHQTGAIVVGYVAGVAGYRGRLFDWYARQTREGHQLRECLSVSHWHHEAGAHAGAAIHAERVGDALVRHEALCWLARDHALRARFWEPSIRHRGSSVHPGARGWGGWKAGAIPSDDQTSRMADEFYRFVEDGRPFKGAYTPGLDMETVAVLQAVPRETIRASAKLVPLEFVVLAAPVYEAPDKDGGTLRWWYPPAEVTRTRPTVFIAQVRNGQDAYNCSEPAPRAWAEREDAVQIGVAPPGAVTVRVGERGPK